MRKKTKRLAMLGAAVAVGALAVGASSLPALADGDNGSSDVDPKIIGGEPAEPGEFPWTMRMTIGGSDACDASLIRPDVALTAAHCTDAAGQDAITLKYGTNKLSDPDIKEVKVSEYTQSPDWSGDSMIADWAVLKLEKPVEDVEPVALAEDDSLNGEEQTVIGWGATESGEQSDDLLKVQSPAVSDKDCVAAYEGEGAEVDPDTMLCAGDLENGGVDACQGDSGGPMGVMNADGVFTQTGIVSWGIGCAEPGHPGVYAQVDFLLADINAAADAFGGEEGDA